MNYEPGSTFKIVAVGGALSDGLITPNTTFQIPAALQFDGRTINDSEPHGNETLTTAGIVGQSSNIGAVEIGQLLGENRFYQWTRRFGFGAPTGIDVPGEEQGLIPPLSDYNNFSMGNLPFGQGESVTPIQLATAYAAIADGGVLRPPHVVAAVGGEAVRTPRGHRILSPQVAAEMRKILEAPLAPNGTASEISIPGYTLAGKTGTAQVEENGQYAPGAYVGSFIGYVPADAPRYVIFVKIERPRGAYYGGTVAAPIFADLARTVMLHDDIMPSVPPRLVSRPPVAKKKR